VVCRCIHGSRSPPAFLAHVYCIHSSQSSTTSRGQVTGHWGARLQVTGTSCLDTVRIPWCICSVKLAVGSKCTIACTETYNTGSPPALAHVNCTPSCQSCATLRWGQVTGHWNFPQVITPTPGCIVSEKIQHESTSPAVSRDTHTCLV